MWGMERTVGGLAIRCASAAIATLALTGILAACGEEQATEAAPVPIEEAFLTSLHATGQGKITWYSETSGGLERFTGISYSSLACQNCHKPECTNCHVTPGDHVSDDKCLGCHGRQQAERAGFNDAHRTRGMRCMDCHTLREMHGDGTRYASLLDKGAMDAKCVNCHKTLQQHTAHSTHAQTVACASCHMKSVVTCYNCHFESEIQQKTKRPHAQFKNWMLLVNRDGKVHPGNFQSVTYQGKAFVAIAPFTAHTILKDAQGCADCHNNAAVQQYKQSGRIQVARWDGSSGKVTPLTGVIPVVPDYRQALRFDFVDFRDGKWVFLKSDADAMQLLFGEPLTAEQMQKLSTPK